MKGMGEGGREGGVWLGGGRVGEGEWRLGVGGWEASRSLSLLP